MGVAGRLETTCRTRQDPRPTTIKPKAALAISLNHPISSQHQAIMEVEVAVYTLRSARMTVNSISRTRCSSKVHRHPSRRRATLRTTTITREMVATITRCSPQTHNTQTEMDQRLHLSSNTRTHSIREVVVLHTALRIQTTSKLCLREAVVAVSYSR